MVFSSLSPPSDKTDKTTEYLIDSRNEAKLSIPSRSIDQIGRFSLSVIVVKPKTQAIVPVVGLILSLVILSIGEKAIEAVAVARLESDGFYSEKLSTAVFHITDRVERAAQKSLAMATEALVFSKTSFPTRPEPSFVLAEAKRHIGGVIEDIRLLDSRPKIKTQIHGASQNAAVILAPLGDTLETAARRLNLQVEILSQNTAMISRIEPHSLERSAHDLTSARLAVRSTVRKGDNVLWHLRAGVDTGLKATSRAARISRHEVTLAAAVLQEEARRSMVVLKEAGASIAAAFVATGRLADRADQALLSSAEYSVEGASDTFSVLGGNLRDWWYAGPRFAFSVTARLGESARVAAASVWQNWRNFIGDKESEPVSPPPVLAGEELREAVRQEVLNELELEFQGVFSRLRGGQPQVVREPSATQKGVVIVPEADTPEGNEAIRSRLKDMFSDPVDVYFDADGQSGVITPKFRDRSGDNYIFLLAPLRE